METCLNKKSHIMQQKLLQKLHQFLRYMKSIFGYFVSVSNDKEVLVT